MKKLIIIISLLILILTGCHEFTNPVDPYLDLIAYYPLEGDGSNKVDMFNTAKLVEAELVSGHFDDAESAYTFSGTDSYMDCGQIGDFDGDTNLSISLWIKQNGSAALTENIFGKYDEDEEEGYYLYVNGDRPMFEVSGSYSSYSALSADSIADDLWHHIVVTGEKIETQFEITLYVDGVKKASTLHSSISYDNSSAPLVFGAKYAGGYEWEGSLDNIRVYSKAITPREVQKLYLETEEGGTEQDPLTFVTSIASGWDHSLFVKANGYLYACGDNNYYELGDGTTTDKYIPTRITSLSTVKAAAAGDSFSLAVLNDGTVRAWGYNNVGQLGLGDTTTRTTPIAVSGLSSIETVAAGYQTGLALNTAGEVYKWGRNESTSPVKIAGINGATAIAAGYNHFLILKSDGTVAAWGNNAYGQLGSGSLTDTVSHVTTLTEVTGLTDVIAVSAGMNLSMALKSDGTVWTWGLGSGGQLGNGSTINSNIPVQVQDSNGVLGSVIMISAGNSSASALKSDGTVWTWGDDYNGNLGTFDSGQNSIAVAADIAVPVSSLGVLAGSNMDSRFAISGFGDVIAWGTNSNYQLGDGGTVSLVGVVLIPVF